MWCGGKWLNSEQNARRKRISRLHPPPPPPPNFLLLSDDTHEDSHQLTSRELPGEKARDVRDAMRVRESRGDEFTAEKRRNTKVEQTRERMRDFSRRHPKGLCAVSRAEHSAARASHAQSLQGCGGVCIPLRGGEAVPSDGLCSVLRNTSTCLKHAAQVDLTKCIPLRR